MATDSSPPSTAATAAAAAGASSLPQERRHRSIFDVPPNFFDGSRLLSPSWPSSSSSAPITLPDTALTVAETIDKEPDHDDADTDAHISKNRAVEILPRLTCNTCLSEFDSILEQRSHFKSDIHRINVKLRVAGKDIVEEEDIEELMSDSFKDCGISSISGSEDETERGSVSVCSAKNGLVEFSTKQKLFFRLSNGERVSIWKCLLLNENESISLENENDGNGLKESEVIEKLKFFISNKCLRIILLASGGHFAGCVFDRNSVVVHKTFHRYVVRAKAGKKQSSKDAVGRAAHSAGASLRRYNELALKKDIEGLLVAWKPYFDAACCVFIHAPSSNRQLLFSGDKPYFSHQHCAIRSVPLNVRRPTFKEARRVYNQLTQIHYEVDEREITVKTEEDLLLSVTTLTNRSQESYIEDLVGGKSAESLSNKKSDEQCILSDSEDDVIGATPLHDAARSGDAHNVMELLEKGSNPCIKDERGKTPYMLANEKEVRDSFRRFMASNPDRWDWHAARVPSALTKEMEESQAAKQTEKDAKRKARAKELKKLRKAREKKVQATTSQNATGVMETRPAPPSTSKGCYNTCEGSKLSEEELKRAQDIEREKRATAAEKRMAASTPNAQNTAASISLSNSGSITVMKCSCCDASLAGKVPFHRYSYKYCSTSCMHAHKMILEDV